MSTSCVCATCTALRQAGKTFLVTPGSNTIRYNRHQALAPLPLPPPPAVLLVSSPATPRNSIDSPAPYAPSRLNWVPTQSSLLSLKHPRKDSGTSSETPDFKHVSFPDFARLPVELRIRIWTYSKPAPRIIELRTWKSSQDLQPLKISAGPHLVPSILHVNQESRLEGLRIFHLEEIGRSLWKDFDNRRTYIPWRYHPTNRYADPEYRVLGPYNTIIYTTRKTTSHLRTPEDPVMPYAPQKVYIDYRRDTIYLGPEFSPLYLEDFLSGPDRFLELPKLQYLALDRKLWLHQENGTHDALRSALYTLRRRPVMEIYIVPDDERGCLEDRWYYGKHDISLKEPALHYKVRPTGQSQFAKNVVENLQEWFDTFWMSKAMTGSRRALNTCEPCIFEILIPKVSIKSIRRGSLSMSDYKAGVWDLQESLGGMTRWKTWSPPDVDKPR